jgi:hypothetical protein
MTSIFDIAGLADVASFFIWTLAVCALAKGIFGSFPAAELQYRLSLRDQPKRQRLGRLNWEVANRTKWDEDVARGSQHAAAVPLTEPELDARRAELHRFSRISLPRRALQYLQGVFWSGSAHRAGSGPQYTGAILRTPRKGHVCFMRQIAALMLSAAVPDRLRFVSQARD